MSSKFDRPFLEVVTRIYIPVDDVPGLNLDELLAKAGKVNVHYPVKTRTEGAHDES